MYFYDIETEPPLPNNSQNTNFNLKDFRNYELKRGEESKTTYLKIRPDKKVGAIFVGGKKRRSTTRAGEPEPPFL